MSMMKSLKERVQEFSVVLPFMEGRDKGELKGLYGNPVTINNFGFLQDDKKENYVVFTVKEDDKRFYFGGLVLTDRLTTLENEGYRDEIENEGLPVLFKDKVKGKNGFYYTPVEFFPGE